MPHVPPGLSPTIQVQSLVDFWSAEPDAEYIQALVQSPRLLLLQIDRFKLSAGTIHKRLDVLEANRRLVIPIFSDESLRSAVAWYELIAVISHHGPHPRAGHYTTTLLQEGRSWQCDDNRLPTHQLDTGESYISSESYLLLYRIRHNAA